MEATRVCIDLGSTSWKISISTSPSRQIQLVRKFQSVTMSLDGSMSSLARFEHLVQAFTKEIMRIARQAEASTIAATGVREGVALVDSTGKLCWASGNVVLSTPQPSRAVGAVSCISLQGYVMYRLGADLVRSTSEAVGHSNEVRQLEKWFDLSRSAKTVKPGNVIGHTPDGRELIAGGFDEQIAYFGGSTIGDHDLVLHMGTYWNLMSSVKRISCPHVRYVAPELPLPGYSVIVGYRWGLRLQEWLISGASGQMLERPSWARGDFLEVNGSEELDTALAAMQKDLSLATSCLSERKSVRVTCTGGGMNIAPSIISQILPTNWAISGQFLDPTALGLGLL